MKKTILVLTLLIMFFLGNFQFVLAAPDAKTGSTTKIDTSLPNPLGTKDVNVLVGRIINNVLAFVGTITLLLFVYGGFIWMTSSGAPEKVKKGRDILVWAVIGMAVVFMSYIIVKFIIQGVQGTI